jgi:hypothetical protein
MVIGMYIVIRSSWVVIGCCSLINPFCIALFAMLELVESIDCQLELDTMVFGMCIAMSNFDIIVIQAVVSFLNSNSLAVIIYVVMVIVAEVIVEIAQ